MANILVLDVRQPEESDGHIAGAKLVPLVT
jgi:rhodanese-related sulfurtransferase